MEKSISLYNINSCSEEFSFSVQAHYFTTFTKMNLYKHKHPRIEIMYIVSGSCIVPVEDTSYTMRKGDFILIDANVAHGLIVTEGTCCRILNVEFIFQYGKINSFPLCKLIKTIPTLQGLLLKEEPYIYLKGVEEIYSILKFLILELDQLEKQEPAMVQLLLLQLFVKIAKYVEDLHNDFQVDVYVKKAIEYMHNHYDEEIEVKDVSKFINLHEAYLSRIFKRHMGKTIMEYLTEYRINKAKMLLENTEIPIIDMCEYLGLGSRQYFTYLFKKHTGYTPYDYRNMRVIK